MGTTIQEVDSNWVMGTYIHRVLVFDGYLYSRVYGIRFARTVTIQAVLLQ